MKESTLAISLLCLGCFLAIHKVNGGESERDYPDVVSLWKTDPDAHVSSAPKACIGQYTKMPGKYSRGKPVWKHNDHEDRFVFFGKNGYWFCSYTYGPGAGGYVAFIKTKGAPRWTRYAMGPKSFVIEGSVDYPDVVSIWNTDPDAHVSSAPKSCIGQYSKMPGKYSRGKPVWKHNDRKDRFFFVGANGFWYCSYTYGPTAGGYLGAIQTKGAPRWTIYTLGPKSFIIEGSFDYPDIVSISNTDPNAHVSSDQKTCLGQYSKMPGKYSRGKPVYKHKDRENRFFFEGLNGFWYCSYTYGPGAGGWIIATWTNGAWKIWGGPSTVDQVPSIVIEGFRIHSGAKL